MPLDHELLAWAAGFFDGEGSTIAKHENGRPNYRQLGVSVPQSGNGHVPELLERFKVAALGTGRLEPPNKNSVYSWRARGRIDAELTLALLWPHLGSVKKAQAALALDLVERQYANGSITRRALRYRPQYEPHPLKTSGSDFDAVSRAWAAGFLDAEGWFGVVRGTKRKDGSDWLRVRVSAPQHSSDGTHPEVLVRLRQVLGAGVIERHGEPDDFKWVVEGRSGVARVLELTAPWLGEVKRAQALLALATFDGQERRRSEDPTRCKRGHLFDRVVVTASGKVRKYCNACARITERARRQKRGAKPRQMRNLPEDSSRAYRAA
jgi:hypothetical protein